MVVQIKKNVFMFTGAKNSCDRILRKRGDAEWSVGHIIVMIYCPVEMAEDKNEPHGKRVKARNTFEPNVGQAPVLEFYKACLTTASNFWLLLVLFPGNVRDILEDYV